MLHTTLPNWLSYLENKHSQLTGKTIDLGLDRVKTIAQSMQLLGDSSSQTSLKVLPHCQIVTVAGTNGKGSFIASCEALLLQKGLRVGAYTSPHILQFNERIRINGVSASDTFIMQALQTIHEHCEKNSISLSYFEFTTLAGLYCFQQTELDVILLEIGLGGRLDAVNIIEPDWAVITSIGIDHQDFLGDDLESIAYEKCGILRANTPLILLDSQPLQHLLAAKEQRNVVSVEDDFKIDISISEAGVRRWQMQPTSNSLIQLLKSDALPVINDNGLSIPSQAGAIILAQKISLARNKGLIEPEQIVSTLSGLSLAGRFQQFDLNGVRIVFDVAHNEQALNGLKQRLSERPLGIQGQGLSGEKGDEAKRIAVFTMLKDKPLEYCINLFKDDFFAWFLAEVDDERAFKPSFIAEKLHDQGVHMISVSKNFTQAFARLRQMCQTGDEIIIFGSFVSVTALIEKVSKLATPVNVSQSME